MIGISSNLWSPASTVSRSAARTAGSRSTSAGASAATQAGSACDSCSASDKASGDKTAGGKSLSADQQKQVESLKQRDAEVRQHEAAHLAAAGGLARGGPVYNYKTGPDGKQYAVGGHVDVDTSAVAGDPKATLAKARQVQRAALAPADPSGQDHAVAASAAAQAANAQNELSAGQTGSAGRTDGGTADATSNKRVKSSHAVAAAATAYAKAVPEAVPAGGGLDVVG